MTDVTAAEHHDSELNDQVVAVGVDGSPEALAAARYAVRAADFRGLNLLMVHAYELPPLDVPMDQGILEACHQAARNLMADVAAQLVVPPHMRIDTVVQPDSPVVLLDDVSRTVPLLVVGQDHLGWGERLTFGAVASHVGQKAQCPVVVVPGGWQAPKSAERHPVVVALDEDTPRDAVLTAAFKNHRQLGRPCLLGYIGKCSAPCVGRIDAADHRRIVEDLCAFLSGQATPMLRKLDREMHQASQSLEFERAARLRDDIGALQQAMEKNAIVLRDGTDADVIALAEDPLEVAVHIFHVRGGRVRGERGWVADRFDDSGTPFLIEQFLLQLYADTDPGVPDPATVPREILVPVLPESLDSLTRLFTERRGSTVEIKVPHRGDKRALMDTVSRNAGEALIRHKTARAGDLSTRNQALEELREALDLPTSPLRIECFDISNLQGTEVVASMVVFEDGLPRKSEYRRFVIRHVDGQNDVAAMHEVITRRFRRLLDDRRSLTGGERAEGGEEGPLLIDPTTGAPRKFAYAPSLVVVDGGPPQVAAAARALDELGISDVALCGLAKRLEEVWLPDSDDPVILPRTSEGLYLLQRLRDEAHRFAITHHRERRSKSMVESVLDQVPGLGEVRRKVLLNHFGSLKKLRAATVEEIAAVPGFGMKTAIAIKQALEALPKRESINTATGEITAV